MEQYMCYTFRQKCTKAWKHEPFHSGATTKSPGYINRTLPETDMRCWSEWHALCLHG